MLTAILFARTKIWSPTVLGLELNGSSNGVCQMDLENIHSQIEGLACACDSLNMFKL